MPKTNLKSLIGKLNETCRRSLELAAGLCLSQTHYEVEVEHFLIKLLEAQDTDIQKILRHFEINQSRLAADLTAAMDSFKTGNSRNPSLSPHIPEMLQEAWLLASVDYLSRSIRSGHILLALLGNDEMARMLTTSSKLFKKISVETLKENFADLTGGSVEDRETSPSGMAQEAGGEGPVPKGTKALDQFTINLTEKARKGEIDPVLGRDFEIRQMADILIRRRQNNPILTGEAGVGKTAVVEGFAMKVVEGDVPPPLRNVEIRSLDLGLLQAGAGIKGEFENRLKQVINEVKSSPVPIIVFIDEAHTLIGAGGAAGQGDAANLLKPALARGEMRTIAATTWSEYKKYFEKDPALARRFQVIKVEEPDEEKAMVMMRAIGPFLEKHHNVMITDEALKDSVRLSHRYIPARQLPDKSVSVLDTACARVAIGLTTKPGSIEDVSRRIGDIERELKILKKESAMGRDHAERMEKLATEKDGLHARKQSLEERWKKELEIAEKILAVRAEIRELFEKGGDDGLGGKQKELKALEAELSGIQKDDPLVQITVDGQTISEVISGWTGIPTGRMLTDEIQTVLGMHKLLAERIIGQDHALEIISQTIQTAHAGIEDPSKPTGVFLLVGPSGVGKTETALALSELLYGGEENLITINMSEYQESHTVSGLKGSPPGYVGYGEGGVLTEAVRKRPYSVVLLDEIEKAHQDIFELFYQVFDKGVLEDGEGRKIDFKNALIILTSNLGTDTIMKACADEETMPDWKGLTEMLRPELVKHFKPAFIGRLKIVPYYPITDKNMKFIVRLKLNKVAKRMKENRNVTFTYDDAMVDAIAARCTEVESGARNVDNILSGTLLPEMSRELLSRMASGEKFREIRATLSGEGFSFEVS
ncbi:MAG TPA: type VI secretion system ATPase TssH [Deltaproteobacteria bacterium]|nr:type VI secretion system ATPase TssH [Deltaproteobacteria bacterium]HPR54435.1 type VI secretion system ATPase TssH [Deltaproteobacteria bacterium]HXK46236.1 type VI secretion system ATPase TssH [Deltaproteobacteria bacterium]